MKNSGTISPEVLDHLFDRFRGGDRDRRRSDGLGLGLYIVSQIVHAHDCSNDVQTGQGDETSFRVQIPRRGAS